LTATWRCLNAPRWGGIAGFAAFLAASAFAALHALAGEASLPALFDVTGVASGDVLNLRAEPSAQATIIGSFPADATGIEVIATDSSGRWGQVNAVERAGWASLAYLARQPGQGQAMGLGL
jgi:hypothetical protein